MSQSTKGFTMIETVAATTTLFLALIIVIPSFILIQQERKALFDELKIINFLEDTLNQTEYDSVFPKTFENTVGNTSVFVELTKENDLQKGCVTWETNQKTNKFFCLYKRNE